MYLTLEWWIYPWFQQPDEQLDGWESWFYTPDRLDLMMVLLYWRKRREKARRILCFEHALSSGILSMALGLI